MYVMIDNYDSFVYNLAAYFRELGQEIRVIRRDRIIPEELEASASEGQLGGYCDFSGPRMSGGGRKASGDRAELGGQGSRAGGCVWDTRLSARCSGRMSSGADSRCTGK